MLRAASYAPLRRRSKCIDDNNIIADWPFLRPERFEFYSNIILTVSHNLLFSSMFFTVYECCYKIHIFFMDFYVSLYDYIIFELKFKIRIFLCCSLDRKLE